MMAILGRQMLPSPTDHAAERRVPCERLRLIPAAARASFVPWVPDMPGLRPGENDLTQISPGRARAQGQVIEISGRVSDELGRPLRGTLIEIWNANRWGRYTHIKDPALEKLDPNFLGFGRALTSQEGRYHFRTLQPGQYLARADIGRWRPAHVHFSIRGGSARLVTQMYFKGDPHLAGDPMFNLLGQAQPLHFGREIGKGAAGEIYYNWDIILGGRNPCFFES